MKPGYHSGKLVFGKMDTIGSRVKKARRWYGMTQKELAALAMVGVATICDIENGDDCYMSTIMLISQGLDIPLERFFTNLPELRR